MRYMGIDPSSSFIGLVITDANGKILHREQYATGLVGTADPVANAIAMHKAYVHMRSIMSRFEPDVVVIEELASAMNLKTVRAIMYFEAIAMIAVIDQGLLLKKLVASSMRRAVFGNGGFSKEKCAEIVRQYTGITGMHLPTERARKLVPVFTDDETDAYAYCLWAADISLADRVVIE